MFLCCVWRVFGMFYVCFIFTFHTDIRHTGRLSQLLLSITPNILSVVQCLLSNSYPLVPHFEQYATDTSKCRASFLHSFRTEPISRPRRFPTCSAAIFFYCLLHQNLHLQQNICIARSQCIRYDWRGAATFPLNAARGVGT